MTTIKLALVANEASALGRLLGRKTNRPQAGFWMENWWSLSAGCLQKCCLWTLTNNNVSLALNYHSVIFRIIINQGQISTIFDIYRLKLNKMIYMTRIYDNN